MRFYCEQLLVVRNRGVGLSQALGAEYVKRAGG